MRDQRLDKWADVLVNFSLAAQQGQTAFLLGDCEALPLIEAAYEKFILAGVKVECVLSPRYLSEFLLKHGSEEQITFTPFARLAGVKAYDHYLFIGANSNSKMLSSISPKKQSLASKGYKPILDVILERSAYDQMRWCYTMFPTPSAAQDAELSNNDYEEFVLNAGFLNDESPVASLQLLETKQAQLIRFLEEKTRN